MVGCEGGEGGRWGGGEVGGWGAGGGLEPCLNFVSVLHLQVAAPICFIPNSM